MRVLLLLFLFLSFGPAAAQTRAVDPSDLILTVTLENLNTSPYQHEMVLLTIHGVYRRHITRENLKQPDFSGINWMQLGSDHWYESTVNGVKVKNFSRRMALFPEKTGRLKVGPFIHRLTLLDENNNWFEHDVRSEPIELEVLQAPQTADWWFPVRGLTVSDRWSNAPDQLVQGAGVLRIITVTAIGIGPDMIPPMPDLRSPSAHIFPHPEKRLVELSPQGPVSRSFWRWTIKPGNGTSTILEPVEFSYFDTVSRELRLVTISPQRVAYARAEQQAVSGPAASPPAELHPRLLILFLMAAAIGGTGLLFGRSRTVTLDLFIDRLRRYRQKRALKRAAVSSDLLAMRRAAHVLNAGAKPDPDRTQLLEFLDRQIYSAQQKTFDFKGFYRKFVMSF